MNILETISSIHIDYISIPGATIRDLHHAFRVEYGNTHRSVDVILCSGLNDVIDGSTSDQIMNDVDIYDFSKTVRSICFGDNGAYCYWSIFAAEILRGREPPDSMSLRYADTSLPDLLVRPSLRHSVRASAVQ